MFVYMRPLSSPLSLAPSLSFLGPIHIYIYIYMYREREREVLLVVSIIYIVVYIYIYIEREREIYIYIPLICRHTGHTERLALHEEVRDAHVLGEPRRLGEQ